MSTTKGYEFLKELAEMLASAERQGAATDEPEGSRYIQLSDTLAREIAERLSQAAEDWERNIDTMMDM